MVSSLAGLGGKVDNDTATLLVVMLVVSGDGKVSESGGDNGGVAKLDASSYPCEGGKV